MCVHIFGGMSSPKCCIHFALKQTSTDNVEYGPAAVQTLQRNFYVDGMLKFIESKEVAIKNVQNVTGMCQKGGFRLNP